jgi:hypothetical protein
MSGKDHLEDSGIDGWIYYNGSWRNAVVKVKGKVVPVL